MSRREREKEGGESELKNEWEKRGKMVHSTSRWHDIFVAELSHILARATSLSPLLLKGLMKTLKLKMSPPGLLSRSHTQLFFPHALKLLPSGLVKNTQLFWSHSKNTKKPPFFTYFEKKITKNSIFLWSNEKHGFLWLWSLRRWDWMKNIVPIKYLSNF